MRKKKKGTRKAPPPFRLKAEGQLKLTYPIPMMI